jgi:phosphatidylserine/phosphatidylglycerophosphate/cardiolipin synthase-like enzyme
MHFIRTLFFLLIFPITALAQPNAEEAFSPRQGASLLVIKTIEKAEKSIKVAAYSFTSKPIADALIKAYQKGIDVKIVLDKSQQKNKHSMYRYFLENKLPTRINRKYAIMHNKFMVIDEKALQLGSFNYTKSAEKSNAENVLVIRRNKKVISRYSIQWQKLWNEAQDLSLSTH